MRLEDIRDVHHISLGDISTVARLKGTQQVRLHSLQEGVLLCYHIVVGISLVTLIISMLGPLFAPIKKAPLRRPLSLHLIEQLANKPRGELLQQVHNVDYRGGQPGAERNDGNVGQSKLSYVK